jgi:putative thioredoxin
MSLAGGMDLSKLLPNTGTNSTKTIHVESLITEVTEQNLGGLVELSKQVAVVLEVYLGSADAALESAVRSVNGKALLGRVNSETQARVAQAFGAKSAPSLFALVKGQPVPIYEGQLAPSQYASLLEQLIAGASDQGVNGTALEGAATDSIPTLPQPLQEALALVDEGEIEKALELLIKLKAESPKDAATSALLAQVNLMQRTMSLDHEAILESQPTNFDEAMVLADVLAAIGDFGAAFELLLSLFSQVNTEDRVTVQVRLLEYFEIAGPNNSDVKSARARLAALIY